MNYESNPYSQGEQLPEWLLSINRNCTPWPRQQGKQQISDLLNEINKLSAPKITEKDLDNLQGGYTVKSEAKKLREAIDKVPSFENGAVIRFKVEYADSYKVYEYVGIYVADKGMWYLSGYVGAGISSDQATTEELIELFSSEQVYGIELADTWEVV